MLVGVLGIQGDVEKHVQALADLETKTKLIFLFEPLRGILKPSLKSVTGGEGFPPIP